jgi:hypothetical protein
MREFLVVLAAAPALVRSVVVQTVLNISAGRSRCVDSNPWRRCPAGEDHAHAEDQVQVELEDSGSSTAAAEVIGQRYGEPMLARCRYRTDQSRGRAAMPARVFGCPRLEFSDSRRTREQAARAAGVRISESGGAASGGHHRENQAGPGAAGEVAWVALVLACRDPRRAYPSFFDPAGANRRGRAVRRPRFRSRADNRASIRPTCNGFRVTARRLRGARILQVRLQWSREVPRSRPASLSSGRGDGRYHASLRLQVADRSLSATTSEVGINRELDDRLATGAGACSGPAGTLAPLAITTVVAGIEGLLWFGITG